MSKQAALESIRNHLKQRLSQERESREEERRINTGRPPRYDEVFWKGTAWLDEARR